MGVTEDTRALILIYLYMYKWWNLMVVRRACHLAGEKHLCSVLLDKIRRISRPLAHCLHQNPYLLKESTQQKLFLTMRDQTAWLLHPYSFDGYNLFSCIFPFFSSCPFLQMFSKVYKRTRLQWGKRRGKRWVLGLKFHFLITNLRNGSTLMNADQ